MGRLRTGLGQLVRVPSPAKPTLQGWLLLLPRLVAKTPFQRGMHDKDNGRQSARFFIETIADKKYIPIWLNLFLRRIVDGIRTYWNASEVKFCVPILSARKTTQLVM